MRQWSKLVPALVATALLVGCADGDATDEDDGSAAEGAAEELELSFTYLRTTPLTAIVARDEGFFEAEGLDVELIESETGGAALEAMMGGSTEITQAADARLPQTLAEGLPVKGIGVNNTGYSGSLVVSADNEEVDDWSDCVGQRVGVQAGSGAHTVWIQYVRDHMGMDPNEDFEVVALDVPDMAGALHGDSIDCALMWQPHTARAAEEGLTRIVMDPHEMAEPIDVLYPFVLITTEDVVETKPEALSRFMAAIVGAQEWIINNEDSAKEKLGDFLGEGVSEAVVEGVFHEQQYDRHVIDDEVLRDLTRRAETLRDEGDADEIPDLEAGIAPEFAEGVER